MKYIRIVTGLVLVLAGTSLAQNVRTNTNVLDRTNAMPLLSFEVRGSSTVLPLIAPGKEGYARNLPLRVSLFRVAAYCGNRRIDEAINPMQGDPLSSETGSIDWGTNTVIELIPVQKTTNKPVAYLGSRKLLLPDQGPITLRYSLQYLSQDLKQIIEQPVEVRWFQ